MLIQYTLKNFGNIKNDIVLNFAASPCNNKEVNVKNIEQHKLRVLKSMAIYGCRASKEELFRSLQFMRSAVVNGFVTSKNGQCLDLSFNKTGSPVFFEVVFIRNNVIYRYGFEVHENKVVEEFLYKKEHNLEEEEVFYREDKAFEIIRQYRNMWDNIEQLIHPSALMISFIANHSNALIDFNEVVNWFKLLLLISDNDQFDKRCYEDSYWLLNQMISASIDHGGCCFIKEISNQTDIVINALQRCQKGQFIFGTKDTVFMDYDVFRTDQVWFMDRKPNGRVSLYGLHEFKSAQNKTVKELKDKYINGFFGGIPYN